MSLATDIIRNSGLNPAPPKPRKANRNFLELTEDRTAGKPKYAIKQHRKWAARVWKDKRCYHVGMHDTAERADIAARLFKHWANDYDPDTIPRKPETLPEYACLREYHVSSELIQLVVNGHVPLRNIAECQLLAIMRELLDLRKQLQPATDAS